jgi:hypothetical protein
MQPIANQLPRVFQANANRFYQRVVLPILDQLAVHDKLEVGDAPSLDVFLDRCAAQVDNHTANEAAKAFALTIDGVFQRQLSRYCYAVRRALPRGFEDLLKECAHLASLDLAAIGIANDIDELHQVANVVRHGEGRACEKLKGLAPRLWDAAPPDYYDLTPGPVPASESMRVRPEDLKRYVRAVVRFWGHADPLPMAVRELTY